MPLVNYGFLGKIIPNRQPLDEFKRAKRWYLNRIRLSMSFFYFGMGFCFASWASRIPSIKTILELSDGDLGSILFALPMGQLTAMPFSGKIVTRFGSRNILLVALPCYALSLTNLGLATQPWHLALGLYFFGLCGNLCNISINTQGVYTEQLFGKPIMGSFHGSWSLAGFFGALVGLLMLEFNLSPYQHFIIVFFVIGLIVFFNYKHLVRMKPVKQEVVATKRFFRKPDKTLVWLGIITFCCMASEGIMFDWSGVYFKDVVKAPGSLVILGYTSFMVMMSSGRFLSDFLVRKLGAKKVLIISGLMISVGLYTAVIFPFLIPSTIAFMLVGLGVSNVIPVIYSTTGRISTVPIGEALTTIGSISFLGFLVGPPLIGYIAELTSLRYSFAFIGIFGFFISFLVYKLKFFNAS